jgi:hypothetical protein
MYHINSIHYLTLFHTPISLEINLDLPQTTIAVAISGINAAFSFDTIS